MTSRTNCGGCRPEAEHRGVAGGGFGVDPRFRRWTIAAAVLLPGRRGGLLCGEHSQRGNRVGPRREARYTQATFAGDVLAAALSPDGRTVAYASGEDGREVRVLVRDLRGAVARDRKGAAAIQLSWLPNGSQALVGGWSEVWLVSRFGGAPRLITRLGAYIAPSPDGSQIAHSMQNSVGFRDLTRRHHDVAGAVRDFRWLKGLD